AGCPGSPVFKATNRKGTCSGSRVPAHPAFSFSRRHYNLI
ncbi:MAG: hypothetical protein, partial [Olavius algarvensis Delta 4 endosymbiont]